MAVTFFKPVSWFHAALSAWKWETTAQTLNTEPGIWKHQECEDRKHFFSKYTSFPPHQVHFPLRNPQKSCNKFRPWCSCWHISSSPPVSADLLHTHRKLAQYKIWINEHILPWVCSTYGIYSTWLAACEAERCLRSFQKIKVEPSAGCSIISVSDS